MTTAAARANTNDAYANYKPMANALRALSMDAVQQANSGHPGMPMGMADVATVLFAKYLKFNPAVPTWPDRDRFIFSPGHGSMLLYSLLYLTGYEKMTLDALKNFRQLGHHTPGHPEVDFETGIETTTGPLGQGISNATGFALAERILNARFSDDLVDHYTYVLASDGDLMEGISHEACSLAGHLKLGKIIVLYDDNGICIDGSTDTSFSEDTTKRFEAYGWDVQEIDGHDFVQIDKAIANAQKTDTPSIIRCKTKIGFGAPTKEGTAASHGSPLGAEEILGARKNLGWDHPPFEIPLEIEELWSLVGQGNEELYNEWVNRFESNRYKDQFLKILDGDVSDIIAEPIMEAKKAFAADPKPNATRKTSGKVLEYLIPALPFMIGGSADLTGSVNTKVSGPGVITADNYDGQYIHYGVREHGMAAAMNGMALHGGVIPYSGTFLCFSDYCRPSIRLSSLMKQRVIYVMTHDSIGLGEDGPTHQPVEHVSALRTIPNLNVMRPCDGIETAECWQIALESQETPTVLSLTRQNLEPARKEATESNLCAFGGYIVSEASSEPKAVLMASGSEVEIAMKAQASLEAQNIPTRVVSMPCMDLFEKQDAGYHAAVLGSQTAVRVAIEAGVRQSWDRWIGFNGGFVGMNSFGDSAPYEELYEHFKITPEQVEIEVKTRL